MGVPKFFRWLSERFPLVIQRHGSRPSASIYEEHFGGDDSVEQPSTTTKHPPYAFMPRPDPIAESNLPPEIDRLYIDVNGIIHGCSHNNEESDEGVREITEEDIFRNICYYLDRIVKDVAQPKELVYLAIDGVAPRAKLNQQRSRRYRSGKEGEIERTVYDAHLAQLEREHEQSEGGEMMESSDHGHGSSVSGESTHISKLKEVEPGRFAGKFETAAADSGLVKDLSSGHNEQQTDEEKEDFHSNAITPGTEFFSRCTRHMEQFVERKVATDPMWQKLTVIFSGPSVPGEGEHKIMQFIREQQQLPDYNPNIRHCIMGQDGDLIMLGLVTHEPNLVLLREQVLFDERRRNRLDTLTVGHGLGVYIHNPNFEFLHMNILRDYLAYEFETSNVLESSVFDLEHTIDDFVFLTFFVGNDFLPHMPALDIAEEAFDLLFYVYRHRREEWHSLYLTNPDIKPYLTDSGNIISGSRLESFLSDLGKHEHSYYHYKKDTQDNEQVRRLEAKYGMETTPGDDIIESKEEADRERFREMIRNSLVDKQSSPAEETQTDTNRFRFMPVLSTGLRPAREDDTDNISLFARMGDLLEYTVAKDTSEATGSAGSTAVHIDDQDLKGRYYYDKFGFSPFDAEKHVALRKGYVEGLVWNLKYYYEGCVSWEFYFPYSYGPMLSDLVGLDEMLEEISFEGRLGEPLKPFEQLMACMPPSHDDLLPEPYRPLMTDESSPIAEFYPRSFTVDMNGKRWPWEAVVLLPFIDSSRLLEAARSVDQSMLTADEIARNQFSDAIVIFNGENGGLSGNQQGQVVVQPFKSSPWHVPAREDETAVFRPALQNGVQTPLAGLPTLRDGLVKNLWRKSAKINVHGTRSRYKTSCLVLQNVPEIVSVDIIAQELIGSVVYINYPHFMEALVTAVSDANWVVRGGSSVRQWTPIERSRRARKINDIVLRYEVGERKTGTGGVSFDDINDSFEYYQTLLHVRPFKGLERMSDGMVVKTYATFEVEAPLFVTSWVPQAEDFRLKVPTRLEKDPYKATEVTESTSHKASRDSSSARRARLPDELPANLRAGLWKLGRKTSVKSVSIRLLTIAASHDAHFPHFSPKRTYTTAVDFGRREIAALGNYHVQRRPPTEKIVVAKKLRSPRGRVLAAGFAVACSFLSGCGAHKDRGVPSLLQRVHIPSISHPSVNSGIRDVFEQTENETDRPFSKVRRTPPLEFAHGTTTLSFAFRGGIVVAVDSRATLGSFVGSKTTQKVLPVNSHMLGTMAGGIADCSFWIRQIRSEAAFYELTNDNKRISVARVSRLLSNALYENRGLGLSIGTMIMGFDDDGDDSTAEEGGSPPQIYYIDDSGKRIEGDLFAVGSGSTFALGILDTERRFDMTVDEAVALGIKAIRHATFRDAYSGGFINVFLITRQGWKRVFSEDLARLSKAPSDLVFENAIARDQYRCHSCKLG